MRPHELTLRGFRSYRDEVTFDFRGRRLIGIVGPIGAGKSTILDGVAFALFGKTPRVQRDTKSLIHQLSDAAHVQLVFEVDGARWRATRALRRRGQGQAKLERLDDAGEAIDTIVMDRAVKERIEQLLGMDFDTFGRSVLLAQNRFAEFLLATDAPRNAVLKGVFGYERFDAALAIAREWFARAEATAEVLGAEGARVVEAKAALADAKAGAEAAAELRDSLRALAPKVDALDVAIAEAAHQTARAVAEAETVARAAARAPGQDDVARAVASADEAAAGVDAAQAEAERTADGVRRAKAARAAAAEAVGDLQAFTDLLAQLTVQADAVTAGLAAVERARTEAVQAEAAVAAAGERRANASHRRDEAAAAEADAQAALDAADEALHAARHADMATTLRAALARGDACPVCGQAVTTIPKVAKRTSLTRAERARNTSATALTKTTTVRERATAAAAEASASETAAVADQQRRASAVADAVEAARTAEAALATTQSALVDQLGEGDPDTLIAERRAELREAETAERTADEAATAARAALDAARNGQAATLRALGSIREQLAASWGLLGEDDAPPLSDDPASLVDAEAAMRSRRALRSDEAAAQTVAAAAADEAARADRAALLADAGLDPASDVGALAAAAEVLAAEAEERRRGLAETVAAGADLDARIAAERARVALLGRLRDDLQPSRFLAWLLDEERGALAELASVHLEELTDGDYRFTEDGTFRIVDVNAAGTEREPSSLSGGETFLASLALALALADMVTRGGGRLDSFFLDEGFGSLDPEHVERAMAGIEHLVGDGDDRLVILVSHVAQMQELLEDLIVLEKDEVAGTSRVLAGARLA